MGRAGADSKQANYDTQHDYQKSGLEKGASTAQSRACVQLPVEPGGLHAFIVESAECRETSQYTQTSIG